MKQDKKVKSLAWWPRYQILQKPRQSGGEEGTGGDDSDHEDFNVILKAPELLSDIEDESNENSDITDGSHDEFEKENQWDFES